MLKTALAAIVLTATASVANAQNHIDTAGAFQEAFKKIALKHEKIPENNEKLIRAAAMKLLEKYISFNPDGTARNIVETPFLRGVEWQGLCISKVSKDTPQGDEKGQGAESCYNAWLKCDKHRVWDKNTNTWSVWRDGGHSGLAMAVRVIKKGNTLEARAYTMPNEVAVLPINSQSVQPREETRGTITRGRPGLPPGMTPIPK